MQQFTRIGLMAMLTIVVPAAALLAPGNAQASPVTVDFESPLGTGYDLFYGATLSTDQSHSATHSALLSVPADPAEQQQLVRIIPSGFTLGDIAGSFWAYLPDGGPLAPYMEFGVDANHNGVWDPGAGADALVIAFITGGGSYPTATWFQTGLDQSTKVQVVDGRPGLTLGTYDSSGTQDTLASLIPIPIGDGSGLNWGDLSVFRAYVAVGEWPSVDSYTSYVDDISLSAAATAVPEPATLALFVASLAGLGAMRRRRKANKA